MERRYGRVQKETAAADAVREQSASMATAIRRADVLAFGKRRVYPSVHDHPLPGDFVVRRETRPCGRLLVPRAFLVCVYPRLDVGPKYFSFDAAVLHAQDVAVRRGGGIQVWAERRGADGQYEKVTTLRGARHPGSAK